MQVLRPGGNILCRTVLYFISSNCITQKLDFADFELVNLKRAKVRLADIEFADYCHTSTQALLKAFTSDSFNIESDDFLH